MKKIFLPSKPAGNTEVFKNQSDFIKFIESVNITEYEIIKYESRWKMCNNLFFVYNGELFHFMLETAWRRTFKESVKKVLQDNGIIKEDKIKVELPKTQDFIQFKQ